MRAFRDRVAVVTGGASGIGRAMAERFAAEGMKLVLADVEEAALERTAGELAGRGAQVLGVRTDVSKAGDVEDLARRALARFGAVHVVCNNAGVTVGNTVWGHSLEDWEWVLGVNLWGVIHGLRSFVPILLEQGDEGHVVNTASMSGLIGLPYAAIYHASKHAVVTISESLHYELALQGAKVKASVLCPGFVRTPILNGERNRPAELQGEAAALPSGWDAMEKSYQEWIENAVGPEYVAELVLEAIRAEKFWILPHPAGKAWIRRHAEDILEERNPVFDASLLDGVTAPPTRKRG